jgi:hypothetical protein
MKRFVGRAISRSLVRNQAASPLFSKSFATVARRQERVGIASVSKRHFAAETVVKLPALAESLSEGEIGVIHVKVFFFFFFSSLGLGACALSWA